MKCSRTPARASRASVTFAEPLDRVISCASGARASMPGTTSGCTSRVLKAPKMVSVASSATGVLVSASSRARLSWAISAKAVLPPGGGDRESVAQNPGEPGGRQVSRGSGGSEGPTQRGHVGEGLVDVEDDHVRGLGHRSCLAVLGDASPVAPGEHHVVDGPGRRRSAYPPRGGDPTIAPGRASRSLEVTTTGCHHNARSDGRDQGKFSDAEVEGRPGHPEVPGHLSRRLPASTRRNALRICESVKAGRLPPGPLPAARVGAP